MATWRLIFFLSLPVIFVAVLFLATWLIGDSGEEYYDDNPYFD
ncbi:MAG TPA: hypothetical protein VFQ47_02985 [Nitrososphaera sp.]|jgi:hypothetical protein|nr:hypothetical protein [Nitrososphaera sp.]